ncbi:MAG: hypothetical protein AMJ79_14280, partial [Phycisphaerae bacterium SM23_30]
MRRWLGKFFNRGSAKEAADTSPVADFAILSYKAPKFNAEPLEPRLLLSADTFLVNDLLLSSYQDDLYEKPAIVVELDNEYTLDEHSEPIEELTTPAEPVFALPENALDENDLYENDDKKSPPADDDFASKLNISEPDILPSNTTGVSEDNAFETVDFSYVNSDTEKLTEMLLAANPPPLSDSYGLPRIIRPGNSPGIVNVAEFNQGPDDILEIEIGGYSPGPGDPVIDDGYDQINVSGEAALDGTLKIVLINDFVPSLNDTFDFVTFGTLSGAFAEVTGPFGFGAGNLYFKVVEQSDRLQLVAAEIPSGEDLHTTTAATERMEQAIGDLADHADQLLGDLVQGNSELTAETIPGTNVSLDDLFDLTNYLNIGPALDGYLAPIQVLGSEVEFDIDEFLNYLRGNWLDDLLGGEAYDIAFSDQQFIGDYDWISGIKVEFSGSASYSKQIPVGISEAVEGIGPAYTD